MGLVGITGVLAVIRRRRSISTSPVGSVLWGKKLAGGHKAKPTALKMPIAAAIESRRHRRRRLRGAGHVLPFGVWCSGTRVRACTTSSTGSTCPQFGWDSADPGRSPGHRSEDWNTRPSTRNPLMPAHLNADSITRVSLQTSAAGVAGMSSSCALAFRSRSLRSPVMPCHRRPPGARMAGRGAGPWPCSCPRPRPAPSTSTTSATSTNACSARAGGRSRPAHCTRIAAGWCFYTPLLALAVARRGLGAEQCGGAVRVSRRVLVRHRCLHRLAQAPHLAQHRGRRSGRQFRGARRGGRRGSVGARRVLLALVLFLWTRRTFWSLSIALRDDYAAAGVPMLPVVVGPRAAAWAVPRQHRVAGGGLAGAAFFRQRLDLCARRARRAW